MAKKTDILVGRDKERQLLDSIVESREPEFVVVYGRRRVGKTFLVNMYFNDRFAFKITGLAKKSTREQLQNFQQTFRGDPQQKVQELLNSGRVSQQDYDRAMQMAQQLQRMLGK